MAARSLDKKKEIAGAVNQAVPAIQNIFAYFTS